jgi:hypothetical protein
MAAKDMSKVDLEDDVKLDGELTNKHLLALVLEVDGIRETEAQRKLQAEPEKVHKWKEELLEQGLIELLDDGLADSKMAVTKAGHKRLTELGKEWRAQEAAQEAPKAKPKGFGSLFKRKADAAPAAKKGPPKDMKWVGLDLAVLASTLFSLYLLNLFAKNPGMEVFSFLFGSVIFSLSLILYHRYHTHMTRTNEVISFFRWLPRLVVSQRNYIILGFSVLLLIYIVAMAYFNPQRLSLYLVSAVVVASTGQLIYSPLKKTVFSVLKFYLGVLMMTLGIVVSVDLMSLTELVFGYQTRFLDLVAGIGLILLVYLNEKALGLASVK